ncbi:MAG: zinc ABC transporter solute-binding protein [Chlorobiaceae bacterium]|jgi:zinc transport system substrate-binding protein|nr:zinc ABC transporter solute-binding protein [Chlorobiaceae bacterium]
MNHIQTRWFAFPVLLLTFFLCGCAQQSETGKLQVVTSIEPLSYFAGRIGGRHTAVSVMVPPGGNPHSYEPSPRQMARLGDAALFIKAGSGVAFELDWMQRFLSLNPGLRVCDASLGVPLIPLLHEGDESGNHHGHLDPHYWLSPENGIVIANNIARSLAEADPANRSSYEVNRKKLVAELRTLDREIRQDLAGIKHRRFLVFHPAWGYYAAAFQLEQIAVEEEGKTLTPRQMQLVIAKARANRIRVVFVSPQFSTSQAETIAAEIRGVTRSVDPLSADYQGNLRRATETFISSMQ